MIYYYEITKLHGHLTRCIPHALKRRAEILFRRGHFSGHQQVFLLRSEGRFGLLGLFRALLLLGNLLRQRLLARFSRAHNLESCRLHLPHRLGELLLQVLDIFRVKLRKLTPLRTTLPTFTQADRAPGYPIAHESSKCTKHACSFVKCIVLLIVVSI